MPRTRDQIEEAAAEADAWLDSLDPATTPVEDTSDLRVVVTAMNEVAAGEARLAGAVTAARVNGRSWGRIAMVLGVSKQAARQRYGSVSEVPER